MKKSYLCLGFSMLLAIVVSCARGGNMRDGDYRKVQGMIWNTVYNVTYRGPEELEDSVLAVLQRVGGSLNVFDDNSLVSRVNRQASTPVDADFVKVYEASARVNGLTDGAFDPTLSPLITAWGFGKGHRPTADTARIDSVMRYVGIGRTRMENGCLVKDDIRVQFNFSAIAKGFGCDAVGEMLERNGVRDWLVEIGGEIAAGGNGPSGKGWRVSVDKPLLQRDTVAHESECVVAFTDMGMATSGNYRNFHTGKDGKSYGHTISARTGRPVLTDVLSATVLAPTAMEADALATSLMSMQSAEGRSLTSKLNLPVMLILSDSTVWMSDKFRQLILTADEPNAALGL